MALEQFLNEQTMSNLPLIKGLTELLARGAEDQIDYLACPAERDAEIRSKLLQRYIGTWKGVVNGTGAVTQRFVGSRRPVATSSGATAWDRNAEPWIENDVLERLMDSAFSNVKLRDLRAAISTIKFNFSLNFSQLADVLRVTRQAVYSWLDEEQDVQIQGDNRRRIEQLESYAKLWWSNAGRQFPKELLNSSLGLLLLKLLKEEVPNDGFIRRVFENLCAELPPKRRFLSATGLEAIPEDEPLTMGEFMD